MGKVICIGCGGAFGASGAGVGSAVTCPHCGAEIVVGPARAGHHPEPPRSIACVGCRTRFDAPQVASGDPVTCPGCGDTIHVGERVTTRRKVRRTASTGALVVGGAPAAPAAPELPAPPRAPSGRSAPARCERCATVFETDQPIGSEVGCPVCGERVQLSDPIVRAIPVQGEDGTGRRLGNVVFAFVVLGLVIVSVGAAAYFEYIDWFARPADVPR